MPFNSSVSKTINPAFRTILLTIPAVVGISACASEKTVIMDCWVIKGRDLAAAKQQGKCLDPFETYVEVVPPPPVTVPPTDGPDRVPSASANRAAASSSGTSSANSASDSGSSSAGSSNNASGGANSGSDKGSSGSGSSADDGSSMHTTSTASSGKTSLGRPIEDATHLAGPRCPFSGISFNDRDEQRAVCTRSPRLDHGNDVMQQYHKTGTPRVRIVDGKTVLKENLDDKPFDK